MTIKSGWTELLKWVGWIDVIVSGFAALIILLNHSTMEVPMSDYSFLTEEITNWPMIGLAAGILIQAFFALGIIMTICNIHDRVADINYYTNKVYSRVEKIG